MTFTLLTIILIVTIIVSLNAFKNGSLMDQLIYSPYRSKHNREYYRMLGHLLIHADSTHLIFNMMSLYFLGSLLEQEFMFQYGSLNGEIHFLVLYVLGGLFATLIPYVRNQDNPNYRSLGASGAVSAVIFAAIIWNPTMEL